MRWFWTKEQEPEPEYKAPEKIDGWKLDIYVREGYGYSYENPEMRPLWKIYKWYLTKDTEKYSIPYKDGMKVVNRSDIRSMDLHKHKIKNEWRDNDET